MTWLKTNWLLLYCIIITAVAVYFAFSLYSKSSGDPGIKSQLQELKDDLTAIRQSSDSLLKVASEPLPEEKTDSLLRVNIAINNKTLNEIRNKTNAGIDTVSGSELRRIFAELPR